MRAWLQEVWYGNASGWPLRPLAPLYRGALALRAAAYRTGFAQRVRLPKPVIVVGNLTVGGTGKTPLVLWLASALAAGGVRAGIASRGYGRRSGKVELVRPESSSRTVGDEPLLLARRGCLVAVGRDRVAAARLLLDAGVDAVIADDGLQHLRLARDCEIVVVDGARGLGNGHLLPAGPLREPPQRLATVDVVVVNGLASGRSPLRAQGAAAPLNMWLMPDGVLPVDGTGLAEPLADYVGRTVHAVAGIGNPARFFAMLRAHGITIIEHPFADHHPFRRPDVAFGDALPVLMTEKDAVKCAGFDDARLRYVRVSAQLEERDARRLLELVLQRVRSPALA